MTILLNKRECREFERVYQWLKIHPEWNMKNIFDSKTFERLEFEKCNRLFYTPQKQIRLHVAAHESGHSIVMASCRCRVDSVRIDINDSNGTLGKVTPAAKPKQHLTDDEQELLRKPMIIIDILIKAGGFVGQSFMGNRTGAYHEKFLVYCMCRHLDDRDQVGPLTNWQHFIKWCRNIILNNEILFWRVVDDLLKNSQLTNEIKDLLHSKIKKESATKFFY